MRTLTIPMALAAALYGCDPADEPTAKLADGPALQQSLLPCSLDREYAFDSGWTFAQYPSSSVQEASVEVAGALLTVAPVLVGSYPGQQYDTLLTTIDCAGSASARRIGTPTADEQGHALVLSHDGLHVIVTGRVDEDLWVAKVALVGSNVVWSTRIGEASAIEIGESIARAEPDRVGDTDYLVAGQANGGGNLVRLYALRIADDGTLRWNRYYEVGSDDQVHASMLVDGDRVRLSTTSSGASTPGTGVYSVFDVDVATGEGQRAHYYPAVFDPLTNNMAGHVPRLAAVPSEDGGGYVASYSTRDGAGLSRANLLRLDADLDVVWERSYGTTTGTVALAVFPHQSRFLLSNASNGSALLFAAPDGTLLHNRRYQAPAQAFQVTPATGLGSGWLLRTVSGTELSVTTVQTPGQGCSQDVPTTQGTMLRDHVVFAPIDAPWGLQGAHPVHVVKDEPVKVTAFCE